MRIVLPLLLAAVVFSPLSRAAEGTGWIKDKKGCNIANPSPKAGETVEWSGACRQGYAEGKGILQFSLDGKPGTRYEGELKGGVMSGRGQLRAADGSVYDGDWVDGKPDGYGKYTAANGDTFVGGWTAGKWDGPGTLTGKDGRRLSGTWRNGEYVGKD